MSDAVQVPIRSDKKCNLYKSNKIYFTSKAYTESNDISVVDSIPATNEFESNNKKKYPARAQKKQLTTVITQDQNNHTLLKTQIQKLSLPR